MGNDTRAQEQPESPERREWLKGVSLLAAGALATLGGCESGVSLEKFLQQHFRELSKSELKELLGRLEKEYSEKYGKPVSVHATPANEGVTFGYALDIS